MGTGRVLATCAAMATVAGCALLVVQLSSVEVAGSPTPAAIGVATARPQTYADPAWSAADTPAASASAPSVVASGGAGAASSLSPAVSPKPSPDPSRAAHPANVVPSNSPRAGQPPTQTAPVSVAAPARGQPLPVGGSTGDATRVITVLAAHYWSTTATLQAWDRAPGGGWVKHGGAILAHVGSQGLTTAPSESKSATPIGSFTLTQAFGADSNPGTALPYFRTNSADWWISQSGPLYNTHQHCYSGCQFDTANSPDNPNEHLVTEVPYYNYAVVIDYNTSNSPTGVRQGAGSAFFLHVTDGTPTAGCVAIPQTDLVSIMAWLTPTAHPRILIGVAG